MDEHPTYKVTELVGTSTTGLDDAVRNGLNRANATLRNVDWFEVTSIRGRVTDGSTFQFQVTLKVGFRLEE